MCDRALIKIRSAQKENIVHFTAASQRTNLIINTYNSTKLFSKLHNQIHMKINKNTTQIVLNQK